MKVAINKCYGGFSVSHEVAVKLKEKGHPIRLEGEMYRDGSGPVQRFLSNKMSYYLDNEDFISVPDCGNLYVVADGWHSHRAHPDLIEAIESSKDPNGHSSDIRIVEIPDDIEWEIDEYDGVETIREKHRRW